MPISEISDLLTTRSWPARVAAGLPSGLSRICLEPYPKARRGFPAGTPALTGWFTEKKRRNPISENHEGRWLLRKSGRKTSWKRKDMDSGKRAARAAEHSAWISRSPSPPDGNSYAIGVECDRPASPPSLKNARAREVLAAERAGQGGTPHIHRGFRHNAWTHSGDNRTSTASKEAVENALRSEGEFQ